jgi:S-DNA-T family DNA segregation ATPase FtsK/SpoIIIE
MFGNKKTPTPKVKIPSSVLKKEAQKIAKKMIEQETRKEKQKVLKEKAKEKAKLRVERQKETSQAWDSIVDEHMKREIWAGVWVLIGILIGALFFSQSTPFTKYIFDGIKHIFGIGLYGIPVICFTIGYILFQKKDFHFPPGRIFFLMFLWVSILGFLNVLILPLEESLAGAHQAGGAIGFAISVFPRQFLGDFVTGILMIGLFWISSMIGFGIRISTFFDKEKTPSIVQKQNIKKNDTEEKTMSSKEDIPKKHFQNDLEIIDSTKGTLQKANTTIAIQSDKEEDALTQAKNKHLSGIWIPPSLDILKDDIATIRVDESAIRKKADVIREKLEQFGIDVDMKSVHVGPTVTQFTLEPSAGIKLTKITALKNDLALALAAKNLRIEAPIPGKSLVGIEIPNEDRAIVGMREILESEAWQESKANLTLCLGRDVAGKPAVMDLAKMPHLLIAGKTGSGKSVAMNAFLGSLLWRNAPDKLKLILIDPKRVELSMYNKLPHLLTPVITEPEKAVSALAWAVAEMNRRYKTFAQEKCRNIAEYNEKFPDNPEPLIVVVIDELADLMMVAGKDVEAAICRIAQLARAIGMHLIVATQRPSVDVVTGLIKANLPARIAFKVSSGIDSRTILDTIGAEDLLGFGDMLYLDGNNGLITRLQGLLITNTEVERLTNHIKLQFPEMIANDEITNQSIEGMAKGGVLTAGIQEDVSDDDLDDLFQEAVTVVLENQKASASFLQRRLEIGYARAARILDQMESKGIIGPSKGAKAREIFGRTE